MKQMPKRPVVDLWFRQPLLSSGLCQADHKVQRGPGDDSAGSGHDVGTMTVQAGSSINTTRV